MDKVRTDGRTRVGRPGSRPLLLLVGILATVALSLAPSAAGSAPPDRLAAALDRVPARELPPQLAAQAAPPRRGMPAFVCQLLEIRMPAAVRNLLQSLGVGPCASD